MRRMSVFLVSALALSSVVAQEKAKEKAAVPAPQKVEPKLPLPKFEFRRTIIQKPRVPARIVGGKGFRLLVGNELVVAGFGYAMRAPKASAALQQAASSIQQAQSTPDVKAALKAIADAQRALLEARAAIHERRRREKKAARTEAPGKGAAQRGPGGR